MHTLCISFDSNDFQAITHYDSMHNMPAALACDQCDETFRDMYSCVKHKHEFHGQFDANFQCYICKEVLYSRFRLGTHMKECHKQFFGGYNNTFNKTLFLQQVNGEQINLFRGVCMSILWHEVLCPVLLDQTPQRDAHRHCKHMQYLSEIFLWPTLLNNAHQSKSREWVRRGL